MSAGISPDSADAWPGAENTDMVFDLVGCDVMHIIRERQFHYGGGLEDFLKK